MFELLTCVKLLLFDKILVAIIADDNTETCECYSRR